MNDSFSLTAILPVVFFALVIAVIAFVIRRTTPERILTGFPTVIYWAAIAWGVIWLGRAVLDVTRTLTAERVPIHFEVSPFWPSVPEQVAVQWGSATIDTLGINDGFTQASAHVTGLSLAARALIAVDITAQALAVVLLCALIARVAQGVKSGNVFSSRRMSELRNSGIAFFTLGVAALFANGFSQSMIFAEARPRSVGWTESVWSVPADTLASQVFGIVSWSWSVSAPTWVFAAAVVVLAVAMVLKRGSELSSDTEGLI